MAESGAGPADSYIGSLISLTSKREIRYEGFLYTVDTEKSNIALQNVRSYGTEGRKKDGPQILASDKVYELITFQGTDIKDLQVKMSPPPPIHNDPAIISLQGQPSQPVSASHANVGPAADLTGNASLTQTASALSHYHSASSGVASWTPLPPPVGCSGNMPVYWQEVYRPPDENRPLDHHLFTPPAPVGAAGPAPAPALAPVLPLPMTPATQALSAPLGHDLPSSRPFKASIFAQSPPSYTPLLQELDRSAGTSTISVVDPANPMLSAAPTLSGLRTLTPVSSSMSSLSPLNADSCDPIHETISISVQPSKTFLKQSDKIKVQPHLGVRSVGPSGVSSGIGLPLVVAPVQTSRKVGKGPVAYKQVYKQVQGARGPLKSGHRLAVSGLQLPSAQPLLPIPVSPIQHKPLIQVQDGVFKSHPIRRRRGRGGGTGRAARGVHSRSKLLEDFDFLAMNEKFKKKEVWDELLKVETVGEGVAAQGCVDGGVETQKSEKAFDRSLSEITRRSVYVKDDFFDSLSCDALNREHGRSERPKFSEQQKIDTETFGSFHLGYHHGGSHRGRHGGPGGRGQGRGNGYHSSSRSSEGRVRPVG